MKVYLDLVFFINFMFDTLLLLTVNIILKRNAKLIRIILGGFIGSISIFFLFLNISSFTLFILKIIISVLMILIAFKKDNFFKNFLYLYLVSIVLGGFLYFINDAFSYKHNGIIFINNGFSINIILILLLTPIILFIYIKQVKSLKNINSYNYKVSFTYLNKKYTYTAFLDTGNNLYDPYTNNPVIILYDKNINIKNPIYIPCNTINGNNLLSAFKLNKIIINDKEIKRKVIIAITNKPFKINGVNMLLHKDYLN